MVMPFGDGVGVVVALSGAIVAAIGFVDDHRTVSKWSRLVVHAAAAALLLHATRHLGPLRIPGLPVAALVQELCALIALMWLLNLYNFMDGIDGLAAVEAVTVSLGLAACIYLGGYSAPDVQLACLATAGASLGFLVWNWPPARIFMGDVGSGFLGFLLGALALVAHRETGLTPWAPAILLAAFVTDASVTLLRRLVRGERWYEAHRLHAYQWLSRRSGSHQPVTVIVLAVNVLWLAPMAIAAARWPESAGFFAAVAYAPVIAGALIAGAGRPEAGT
jgi:Fuc2NAc and GlcNAc transferase